MEKGRHVWNALRESTIVQVAAFMALGIGLAALAGPWGGQPQVETTPSNINMHEGQATHSTPYVLKLPKEGRHRLTLQLRLEEGGQEATATAILLKDGGQDSSTRTLQLTKRQWVEWTAVGDYRRLLVEVVAASAGTPAAIPDKASPPDKLGKASPPNKPAESLRVVVRVTVQ